MHCMYIQYHILDDLVRKTYLIYDEHVEACKG